MTTVDAGSAVARSEAYRELDKLLREAALLSTTGALLNWDQQTKMPAAASETRSEQVALLSRLHHERVTDPRIGELIEACGEDAAVAGDGAASADLREIRRDYEHATRLPAELVTEMARARSVGMLAWKRAREENDFARFLPHLSTTVELSRRKAECLGLPEGGSELYDALLDQFEPGMTAAQTEAIFEPLRAFTADLLGRVTGSGVKVDTSVVRQRAAIESQVRFCEAVSRAIGYDYEGGRLDSTTHPFCESMGPGDTRITSRWSEDWWAEGVLTVLHEAGHGVYEQGLPKREHFGRPLGEAVSLGIHESQSRMWENQVGRSRPFWSWALGVAEREIGGPAKGLDLEAVFRAMNVIEPSYIRVEADELTYNLHIMLRFAMERAMLRGDLSPADLPGAWNERFERDFGIKVPDDARGCLQDVHWSMGAIGYFPTYTFGNLYAGQFWEKMGEDIADREALIGRGEFGPILEWTREHIHRHGRRFRAPELCERVTGRPLAPEPLMRHLEAKASAVYGV